MPKRRNLSGQKFTNFSIISFSHISKNHSYYLCQCNCGTKKIIEVSSINKKYPKSCGCLPNKRNTTHGMLNTPIYRSWQSMIQRCVNPNNDRYAQYGGRGIKVYSRWRNNFFNFLNDMGDRPKGTSLDRIDNDGNYTPVNCRWATPLEQQNNMKSNIRVSIGGTTHSIAQWARIKRINAHTIRCRIRRGWPSIKAVLEPIGIYKRKSMI